ncbi:hypothetical protein [Mesorhizobium sp. WSM3862]|uniref:hypothetical protein n=1 Tax=Mesorhizobium sp. WSM3862 TaxID=632858 RepID=UPI001596BD13|nr:hypothetical protein [Mesorhizobium sp. WSM3862]
MARLATMALRPNVNFTPLSAGVTDPGPIAVLPDLANVGHEIQRNHSDRSL